MFLVLNKLKYFDHLKGIYFLPIKVSCPRTLIWDISRDLCHSPTLLGRDYYFDASENCKQLYDFKDTTHPTIMAVRNENDTEILNIYAGELYYKMK